MCSHNSITSPGSLKRPDHFEKYAWNLTHEGSFWHVIVSFTRQKWLYGKISFSSFQWCIKLPISFHFCSQKKHFQILNTFWVMCSCNSITSPGSPKRPDHFKKYAWNLTHEGSFRHVTVSFTRQKWLFGKISFSSFQCQWCINLPISFCYFSQKNQCVLLYQFLHMSQIRQLVGKILHTIHHLPRRISEFFGGKKNIRTFSPTTHILTLSHEKHLAIHPIWWPTMPSM